MNIFNKQKEEIEVPVYFSNIRFQGKDALIKSVSNIINVHIDELSLKRVQAPNNISLADLLKDRKLNEKTKYKLVMFGEVLNGLLKYFDLQKKAYISFNDETGAFAVNAISNDQTLTTITKRGSSEFIVSTANTQDAYSINDSFIGVDKFGYSYSRYFRVIDSDNCYLSITHAKHVEKERLENGNYYKHQATLVSVDPDWESKMENRECCYSYQCGNENSKINIQIKEARNFKEEKLKQIEEYVKGLSIPVEAFTLLSDIGEKLSISRGQVGLSISQTHRGVLYDEITVDFGKLESIKTRSIEDDSVVTILPHEWRYETKEFDALGKERFSYNVKKRENYQPIYTMNGTSFMDFMDMPSSSELYKSGKKAYEKTLSQVPYWIKRN